MEYCLDFIEFGNTNKWSNGLFFELFLNCFGKPSELCLVWTFFNFTGFNLFGLNFFWFELFWFELFLVWTFLVWTFLVWTFWFELFCLNFFGLNFFGLNFLFELFCFEFFWLELFCFEKSSNQKKFKPEKLKKSNQKSSNQKGSSQKSSFFWTFLVWTFFWSSFELFFLNFCVRIFLFDLFVDHFSARTNSTHQFMSTRLSAIWFIGVLFRWIILLPWRITVTLVGCFWMITSMTIGTKNLTFFFSKIKKIN